MTGADDFHVRLGRIRGKGSGEVRSFIGQVAEATTRAGGYLRSTGRGGGRFGRGRAAALNAGRGAIAAQRGAVVKARVVRQGRGTPLAAHLRYLQRDGVDANGEPGVLFDADKDRADAKAFAERCAEDRHHFRFIVSPDDGERMGDLTAFTRDLMKQAEADLGTRLDWVAVEHRNTAHPHLHILVRGRDDQGRDLVIGRDYIREGLRGRASRLVDLELGPRSEAEIRQALDRNIDAERFTPLDRELLREAGRNGGLVDLRPPPGPVPLDAPARIGRMRTLARLDLAEPAGLGVWRLAPDMEARLRDLGREQDIIARLHAALPGRAVEQGDLGVVGRLAARGLDDELKGSAWAVVEDLAGRARHMTFRDLEGASDAPIGAIVELRMEGGRRLTVRSDLTVEAQSTARGSTWLDRRIVRGEPEPQGDGFAADVRKALEVRRGWLRSNGLGIGEGIAFRPAARLLDRLQDMELAQVTRQMAERTGKTVLGVADGEPVEGVYRRRLDLVSGRYAVLQDDRSFRLVRWSPRLEAHRGQTIAGVGKAHGAVSWRFDRDRGMGR